MNPFDELGDIDFTGGVDPASYREVLEELATAVTVELADELQHADRTRAALAAYDDLLDVEP